MIKWLLFVVLCNSAVSAQSPKVGDNMYDIYSKLTEHHIRAVFAASNWFEGNVVFQQAPGLENSDPEYAFLRTKKMDFFGIWRLKQPQYVLIDLNGDGTLDIQTNHLWLPAWVVKKNSIINKKDKSILKLLEKSYESTLQSDDGYADESIVKKYTKYQTDTSLANRHIAYLWDSYQGFVFAAYQRGQDAPPEVCIPIVKQFVAECDSLYGIVPAIAYIYCGEAHLNAGMREAAAEYFKKGLAAYPKSIPLQVYDYQMEQDSIAKEQKLVRLRKKYWNHWMVKGIR